VLGGDAIEEQKRDEEGGKGKGRVLGVPQRKPFLLLLMRRGGSGSNLILFIFS